MVSPTRFLSRSMMPCTPTRSMSLALMVSKPHRMSCRMSPFRLINGARIPAWIEELRIQPSSWARWRKVPIAHAQLETRWSNWLLHTMIDSSVKHPSTHVSASFHCRCLYEISFATSTVTYAYWERPPPSSLVNYYTFQRLQ